MVSLHYKDEGLNSLAATDNVAQFVSFCPKFEQRFAHVCGFEANHVFSTPEDAVAALLSTSSQHSVNVRSFRPEKPQGCPFHYGLTDVATVCETARSLASQGYYTIINETIDVSDGGVSGVSHGFLVEFAPNTTPRGVEKAGVGSLARTSGWKMLEIVYGFEPEPSKWGPQYRVEWSLHPRSVGIRRGNSITWEIEQVESQPLIHALRWPNGFSRLIGDKTFGLLAAHVHDFPVPRTTVFCRNRAIAPFSFGSATGLPDVWTRTCPAEQMPGLYTTLRGWSDPYALMETEDPEKKALAAVLVQQSVHAFYSGAAITGADGEMIIEGGPGFGDDRMLGTAAPTPLNPDVYSRVKRLAEELRLSFGHVRFEWAYDGTRVWVLQLHRGQSRSIDDTIYPGAVQTWVPFHVESGIEVLRSLCAELPTGSGVEVIGEVGMTSHVADLLRRAAIPSRMVRMTDKKS